MNNKNYFELYVKYKQLYEEQLQINEQLSNILLELEASLLKKTRKKKIIFDYNNYLRDKENGLTNDEIANQLGISLRTLNRYLTTHKVNPISLFDYDVYCTLHNKGIPDYKIAKQFNISPSTLSRRLASINNNKS